MKCFRICCCVWIDAWKPNTKNSNLLCFYSLDFGLPYMKNSLKGEVIGFEQPIVSSFIWYCHVNNNRLKSAIVTFPSPWSPTGSPEKLFLLCAKARKVFTIQSSHLREAGGGKMSDAGYSTEWSFRSPFFYNASTIVYLAKVMGRGSFPVYRFLISREPIMTGSFCCSSLNTIFNVDALSPNA
jgi:hypothetical protein